MPDSKITALASTGTGTDPANDPLVIVDVSDTSMAATGTTKKVTLNQLLACSPTATLASATITGDLTVDTSTLKVDSTNNRVGVNTTTPDAPLDVTSAGTASTYTVSAVIQDGTYPASGNPTLEFNGFIGGNGYRSGIGSIGGQQLAFYTPSTFGVAPTERYRLASDGVATWSNVGGVAGTAMTLNSTGLGVGASPSTRLHISNTGDVYARIATTSVSKAGVQLSANGVVRSHLLYDDGAGTTYLSSGTVFGGSGQALVIQSGTSLGFYTNNQLATAQMTVDSAGNVGIGVTPSAWNSSYRGLQLGAGGAISAHTSASLPWLVATSNSFINSVGDWKFINNGYSTRYLARGDDGTQSWWTSNNGSAGGTVSYTQAMTLAASGALLIGQTTAGLDAQGGFWLREASSAFGSSIVINHRTAVGTGNSYAEFTHNGIGIGSITQNGTTGVLYNINSDYRLKESVAPLSGGLARVNSLKPSIYKWKSDGSSGEGFLAHELAEVVPAAVTGEKDAVNEDGSIKSQGIDMSRVVPILVAAIQELAAEVNALKKA